MTTPNRSPIPGFSCLLVGDAGSGKTYSLRSLANSGLTTFVIMTEPTHAVLADIPCPTLHWHYIPPVITSFEAMIDSANRINQFSFEALAKTQDPNRTKHRQWIEVLSTLHNFKCDRCGQEFGDISTWNTSRVIAIDSLSGLNPMAMGLQSGDKPVKAQHDWQIAQKLILDLVQKLCTDRRCHLVMTAHPESEIDEITGGKHITVSTLGRKLAPQIPRFFDEVVHTVKDGTKFHWSTATFSMVLKARMLPIATNLPPSFEQLVKQWGALGGLIES